jgi:hypothetical protein
MSKLERRLCLYGEKRLTDPQVRALRGAASAQGLEYARMGWASKDGAVTQQTVLALRNQHLVAVIEQRIVITIRGRDVLHLIDEAALGRGK